MSELILPPKYDLRSALSELAMPAAGVRGFNTAGDVITQTVDGRPLNDLFGEFQRTLALFNQGRQALVNLLTFPVTQPVEEVPQGVQEDFEEASEFGTPKGIGGFSYFNLGYDFKWYDIAIRYTWKFLLDATAQQVENLNQMAMDADNRLVFKMIMKAVFNNVARTASIRGTAVSVYPFYSNDGTTPPTYETTTFSNTHNHYLTSGAAAITSGDLDEIEDHIAHHGYGADTGGNLILLVNKTEAAVMRAWRVLSGNSYDFIPAQGQPAFLTPGQGLEGGRASGNLGGMMVVGTYGNWTIVQNNYIPSGYVFGFATGGAMQASNPVGFREHQNTGARGLQLVKGRDNDYPLVESFYRRGFGTGVRHRGAGVVMQITAAGAYTIPTIYA
jgi:hypothetical protein